MKHKSGFMADLSPQTQANRARRANTPWRNGPMCDSPNAGKSFKAYTAAKPATLPAAPSTTRQRKAP